MHQGLPTHTVDFPDGLPHRVARLPPKPGVVTETLTGARCAPLLGRVDEHSGSIRVLCMPTMWVHVNCDYAMLTRMTPIDGPLSPLTESSVGTLHDWYLSRLEAHAVA